MLIKENHQYNIRCDFCNNIMLTAKKPEEVSDLVKMPFLVIHISENEHYTYNCCESCARKMKRICN